MTTPPNIGVCARHERMLAEELDSELARGVHLQMAVRYDNLATQADGDDPNAVADADPKI